MEKIFQIWSKSSQCLIFLSFIGNKKGKAGIFMKISKKLIIMLFGILLIGYVLNGAVKRKNPVINDKRRELVFKKFNCNKKIYTVNYITDETVQLLDMKTYKKRLMDRVVSANGERYGDENVKIHIKGSHMTLTQNGRNTSCFLVK